MAKRGRKKGSTTTAALADLITAHGEAAATECQRRAMATGELNFSQTAFVKQLKLLHKKLGVVPGTFPTACKAKLPAEINARLQSARPCPIRTFGSPKGYCLESDYDIHSEIFSGQVKITKEAWLYEAIACFAETRLTPNLPYMAINTAAARASGSSGQNPDIVAYTSFEPPHSASLATEVVAFDAKPSVKNWVHSIGAVTTYSAFANRTYLVLPVVCRRPALVSLFFEQALKDYAARLGLGILAIIASPKPSEDPSSFFNHESAWHYERVLFFTVVEPRAFFVSPVIQLQQLHRLWPQYRQRTALENFVLAKAKGGLIDEWRVAANVSKLLAEIWDRETTRFGIPRSRSIARKT